jgi:hypothetical protein
VIRFLKGLLDSRGELRRSTKRISEDSQQIMDVRTYLTRLVDSPPSGAKSQSDDKSNRGRPQSVVCYHEDVAQVCLTRELGSKSSPAKHTGGFLT